MTLATMSGLSFSMDRPRRPAHLTTTTLLPGLIMVALALTLTWTGWINDIGNCAEKAREIIFVKTLLSCLCGDDVPPDIRLSLHSLAITSHLRLWEYSRAWRAINISALSVWIPLISIPPLFSVATGTSRNPGFRANCSESQLSCGRCARAAVWNLDAWAMTVGDLVVGNDWLDVQRRYREWEWCIHQ